MDDGSSDGTGRASPTASPTRTPMSCVSCTIRRNLGYGAAVRSGLAAARYPLVCFTDGDRQFRVADLARLTARLDDMRPRTAGTRRRGRLPHQARRPCRPPGLRPHLPGRRCASSSACACAIPTAPASSSDATRSRACRSSRAARSCRRSCSSRSASAVALIVEQGVPHYPRTAGRASGADPRVVLRAVRDFWSLRLRLWADKERRSSAASPSSERPAKASACLRAPRRVDRRAGGHHRRSQAPARQAGTCRRGWADVSHPRADRSRASSRTHGRR